MSQSKESMMRGAVIEQLLSMIAREGLSGLVDGEDVAKVVTKGHEEDHIDNRKPTSIGTLAPSKPETPEEGKDDYEGLDDQQQRLKKMKKLAQ